MRRALLVMMVGSVAVVVVAAFFLSLFDHGRDQSIYHLVAREMLSGGMPYRDAFDFKPPGIFLLYAFARGVFGPSTSSIRWVEVGAIVATSLGLIRLSKLHLRRPTVGYLAAALSALLQLQLDFWHTGQPESFGGPLTLWGLVCASLAIKRPPRAFFYAALSGLCFGAAGLMKPPLAFGCAGALFLPWAGWLARRVAGQRAAAPLGLTLGLASGAAVVLGAVIGWFFARGALHDAHEVLLVFTPYYTKLSWEGQSPRAMGAYGFTEWLTGYSSALFLGMVLLLVNGVRRWERSLVAMVGFAIVIHIAGVVAQGKFFAYHWGATFPLSALLAAMGYEHTLVWAARRSTALTVLSVATAIAIGAVRATVPSFGFALLERNEARLANLGRPANQRLPVWDALASVGDVDAGENRAVGTYLQAVTEPGEPIFVWGFECAIYDLAERPIASRYIYNVPQRASWSAGPMQAALMADLTRTPPRAIVVEHGDVFAMVTGDQNDSARALRTFPGLAHLLESSFEFETTIGDFDIYLRRPEDSPE